MTILENLHLLEEKRASLISFLADEETTFSSLEEKLALAESKWPPLGKEHRLLDSDYQLWLEVGDDLLCSDERINALKERIQRIDATFSACYEKYT